MSKRTFLQRVPLEEARSALLALARPTEPETVATEHAAGRVTAEPLRARLAAPHYRASAMDGIAVRAADTAAAAPDHPVRLPAWLQQEAPGRPACTPVDTGSPMPEWADAVIRIENTTPAGEDFEIRSPASPGQDVRQIGEDVEAGVALFGRGHRLRPVDIGVLLATGVYEITVARRPRIATIATGDEIVEPGTEPRAGDVIEFNSRMLAAFADEWGAEAVYTGAVADRREAIVEAVRRAAAEADIVCIIAGSSAGRKDLTAAVLGGCGRLLAHGIDIMPGKPTAVAEVGGRPVIGLPGYPVSAAIVCRELLRPLIAATLDAPCDPPETVTAEVRRRIPSKLGVEEFVRVCLTWNGEGFVVAPLPRGAGSISTLARADGIVRIGPTTEGIDRGRTVEVELLRPAASVRRTIVVAGSPSELIAGVEERLRSSDRFYRFTHLGLADTDALAALAVGQVHLALFEAESAEQEETLRARLAERAPAATLIRIADHGSLLVLSDALGESARRDVLDGVETDR